MSAKILARRPYNVYNIFFILERARLLQDCIRDTHHDDGNQRKSQSLSSCCDLVGFEQLNLPELPPRYLGLQLPPDWYVPGGKAKRRHVATNGCEYSQHRLFIFVIVLMGVLLMKHKYLLLLPVLTFHITFQRQ